MTFVQHYSRNTVGRDLAVGDIHGMFRLLQTELDNFGFDPATDRLFSVGDLVDRGPESDRVLEWLSRPWFHAVRGNHDQMAIDWAAGWLDPHGYNANGGGWNIGNPPHVRQQYADALSCLPLGIDIDFPAGLVGIVHADCPHATWDDFRTATAIADRHQLEAIGNMCMWSRDRVTHSRADGIPDLVELIVGHTPMQRMTTLGNVRYIDTGACFGRDLTVINMTEMYA